MLIRPISITKISPEFTSRNRIGQEKTNKAYQGQIPSPPLTAGSAAPYYRNNSFHNFLFNTDRINPKKGSYDSFTGLRDKNFLLTSLEAAINGAKKNDKNLSVAMFDMDNFKSINELLGYETGDKFILEISKNILNVARENKLDAYRFGGEEFVLIFDNQPDSKKAEIAKNISQKLNSNTTIQSYKDLYLKNAQLRLDKALEATSKVQKISELKTKKETIKEVLENLTSNEAKSDPYFAETIDKIDSEIKAALKALVKERLFEEPDEKNRLMLHNFLFKLSSNEKLSDSEQKKLLEYLYSVYDKANEIYQTKKWMDDFKQNCGFGITCGVVSFSPQLLKYKSPMDVIENAGQILKQGKSNKKGRVYIDSVQ